MTASRVAPAGGILRVAGDLFRYRREVTDLPHGERPIVRFVVDVDEFDPRARVDVIRTGGADDGPWGVDLNFDVRTGAATIPEAQRWARAVLAAADLASMLNGTALTDSERAVLDALTAAAAAVGVARIAQQDLADQTGRSLRTVRRALRRLEQLGRIERRPQRDECGWREVDACVLLSQP